MNVNKANEKALTEKFEKTLIDFKPKNFKYLYLNFDELTRNVNFNAITRSLQEKRLFIKNLGSVIIDVKGNDWKIVREQNGVARINCLAC